MIISLFIRINKYFGYGTGTFLSQKVRKYGYNQKVKESQGLFLSLSFLDFF